MLVLVSVDPRCCDLVKCLESVFSKNGGLLMWKDALPVSCIGLHFSEIV